MIEAYLQAILLYLLTVVAVLASGGTAALLYLLYHLIMEQHNS